MHPKASTTLSSDILLKMKELEEFSYFCGVGWILTSTDWVIDSLRSFVSAWCRKLAEVSRPVFDVLSKNHGFIIIYKSSLALRIKIEFTCHQQETVIIEFFDERGFCWYIIFLHSSRTGAPQPSFLITVSGYQNVITVVGKLFWPHPPQLPVSLFVWFWCDQKSHQIASNNSGKPATMSIPHIIPLGW